MLRCWITTPERVRLLNEARETTELVIDSLFEQVKGKILRKPRCNRDKARNLFLAYIKKKKHSTKEIREALKYQLNEVHRNLKSIDKLIACGATLSALKPYLYSMTLHPSIEVMPLKQQAQPLDLLTLRHLNNPCHLIDRLSLLALLNLMLDLQVLA